MRAARRAPPSRLPAARALVRDDVRDYGRDDETDDEGDREPGHTGLIRHGLVPGPASSGKAPVRETPDRSARPATREASSGRRPRYLRAVKRASGEEKRDQREAPIASRRDLARYRLPLREAVDEEHASGHDRDEIEREERVEQRLRGWAGRARARGVDPVAATATTATSASTTSAGRATVMALPRMCSRR